MRSHPLRQPSQTTRQRQHGVALFVTLMILLVITIIGLVSMRLGLTQSVISRNSIVDNITFQAAEAGLNAVMEEAMTCDNNNTCQSLDNVIGGAGAGVDTVRCLTNAGVKSVASIGLCGYTDTSGPQNYMDKRGTVRAYAVTSSGGQQLLEGYSTLVGAIFVTEATAQIPALGASEVHVQEFSKVAPAKEGLD